MVLNQLQKNIQKNPKIVGMWTKNQYSDLNRFAI